MAKKSTFAEFTLRKRITLINHYIPSYTFLGKIFEISYIKQLNLCITVWYTYINKYNNIDKIKHLWKHANIKCIYNFFAYNKTDFLSVVLVKS